VRASKFLEANTISVSETVSANKKLQAEDARAIAEASDTMIVMKGKKVSTFEVGSATTDEAVTAMLGATGNMRAPLLRVGKLVLVGYNEEIYQERLG